MSTKISAIKFGSRGKERVIEFNMTDKALAGEILVKWERNLIPHSNINRLVGREWSYLNTAP